MRKYVTNRFAWFLEKLPEFITYIGVIILVSDDLVSSLLNHPPFFDMPKRLSLVAASLAALTLSFHLHRRALNSFLETRKKEHLGVEELIPSTKALDLEDIFKTAKLIRILTLAGTKLARLGEQTIIEELRSSGKSKNVIILLANPFSQSIRTRYEFDEPPNFETGLEGLERRLRNLYALRQSMTAGERRRFEVRVFDCYPTCSIVQCDKDLYSTTYGYHLRGTDCPKIHAKLGGRYADFLLAHFEKVYESSKSLEDWVTEHPSG